MNMDMELNELDDCQDNLLQSFLDPMIEEDSLEWEVVEKWVEEVWEDFPVDNTEEMWLQVYYFLLQVYCIERLFEKVQAFMVGEVFKDKEDYAAQKEILIEIKNKVQRIDSYLVQLDKRFPHFQDYFYETNEEM